MSEAVAAGKIQESKLETETLIHAPESWTERLDVEAMFPVQRPLEVELGSGDGSFMLAHAKQSPSTNFIAVERLLGRLRKLDRKGRRAGVENLKLVRIEASYFVEWLMPAKRVRAIHIYFPDPWPKRKHHKHRLIDDVFVGSLRGVLQVGGYVYLRTDSVDYFKQMLKVFEADEHFTSVETPAALKEIRTDFEKWFNEQGIPTNYAAYQLGVT